MSKSRNWLGTLNNPKVDAEEFLQKWFTVGKAKYVVGQVEKGEEGTVHIQYFLNYGEPVRLAALKKHCAQSHFEEVKINNGAHAYCMKEETRVEGPWEFGTKPVQRNSKTDWEEVKKNAIEGKLDSIPADIFVKHYGNLKQIKKDYQVIAGEHSDLKGQWLFGKAGAGKSRKARDENPGAYFKLCNKWWDGYQGQETVIMDDFGKEHAVLGHHLKLWADRYHCPGEIKNGQVALTHKKFVVTSQYHPCEIWEDEPTRAAILRRFEVIQVHRTVQQALMERDLEGPHADGDNRA